MPVTFSMLPDRNLALVTYQGFVAAADFEAAMLEVAGRRSLRPCNDHLVDLTPVTAWDDGLAAEIREIAARERWLLRPETRALCVYYAPSPQARDLAAIFIRTWEMFPSVVALVVEDEAEALAILGQSEVRVADLRAAA